MAENTDRRDLITTALGAGAVLLTIAGAGAGADGRQLSWVSVIVLKCLLGIGFFMCPGVVVNRIWDEWLLPGVALVCFLVCSFVIWQLYLGSGIPGIG